MLCIKLVLLHDAPLAKHVTRWQPNVAITARIDEGVANVWYGLQKLLGNIAACYFAWCQPSAPAAAQFAGGERVGVPWYEALACLQPLYLLVEVFTLSNGF